MDRDIGLGHHLPRPQGISQGLQHETWSVGKVHTMIYSDTMWCGVNDFLSLCIYIYNNNNNNNNNNSNNDNNNNIIIIVIIYIYIYMVFPSSNFDHFDVDDHPIINHQPTGTATFHSGHFLHGGVFMAWGHTTLWGPTFQSRSLLVNLHDPRDSFRRKNQGFPCVPSDPLLFPHHHPKFYQTTRDK